jgi:hypothetical protein
VPESAAAEVEARAEREPGALQVGDEDQELRGDPERGPEAE